MTAQPRLQIFIELRLSVGGCYVKARLEGAPDRLPRTFVGVLDSREEAMRSVVGWALAWLRRLREVRQPLGEKCRA